MALTTYIDAYQLIVLQYIVNNLYGPILAYLLSGAPMTLDITYNFTCNVEKYKMQY